MLFMWLVSGIWWKNNWSVGRAVKVLRYFLFCPRLRWALCIELSVLRSLQPGGWFANAPRHDSGIATWLADWLVGPAQTAFLASIRWAPCLVCQPASAPGQDGCGGRLPDGWLHPAPGRWMVGEMEEDQEGDQWISSDGFGFGTLAGTQVWSLWQRGRWSPVEDRERKIGRRGEQDRSWGARHLRRIKQCNWVQLYCATWGALRNAVQYDLSRIKQCCWVQLYCATWAALCNAVQYNCTARGEAHCAMQRSTIVLRRVRRIAVQRSTGARHKAHFAPARWTRSTLPLLLVLLPKPTFT